jgi:hypothetical protein
MRTCQTLYERDHEYMTRPSLSGSQDTAPDVYETADTVGAADLAVSPRSFIYTLLVLGANRTLHYRESHQKTKPLKQPKNVVSNPRRSKSSTRRV